MSENSRSRMTSCVATTDIVLGRGTIIPTGTRFYVSNKTNQRNFAGQGRGRVGVYNYQQTLLEYVSPAEATTLKEAYHALEKAG